MTRRPRRLQWTEAACYHLINRGHNRETVFATDADRLKFLELLRRYRHRFDLRVYAYCLMSNHFHLLVQLREPRELSGMVAGLLRSYVHYHHRRTGFVGHLWQGRFKSPAVQAQPYLLSCARYLERNPLAADLVAAPWDWPWSSCRAQALGEANDLVDPNPYYLELGADPARRQQRWREFLLGEDPKEEAIRRQDWLVGDEGFRQEAAEHRSWPVGRGKGRPRKSDKGAFLS
jgi:putative transposase